MGERERKNTIRISTRCREKGEGLLDNERERERESRREKYDNNEVYYMKKGTRIAKRLND